MDANEHETLGPVAPKLAGEGARSLQRIVAWQ
jgi:hypothetical protein